MRLLMKGNDLTARNATPAGKNEGDVIGPSSIMLGSPSASRFDRSAATTNRRVFRRVAVDEALRTRPAPGAAR